MPGLLPLPKCTRTAQTPARMNATERRWLLLLPRRVTLCSQHGGNCSVPDNTRPSVFYTRRPFFSRCGLPRVVMLPEEPGQNEKLAPRLKLRGEPYPYCSKKP